MFKRFRRPDPPPAPPECQHKWRDFDWYMETRWFNNYLTIQITEPYVCVACKKRKDVVLMRKEHACKLKEAAAIIAEYEKVYADRIRDKVTVEDEVNDAILVDREFIDAWDRLHKRQEDEFLRGRSEAGLK